MVYPPQLWSINYLYVWLVLGAVSIALRGFRTPLVWALVSGTFYPLRELMERLYARLTRR